MLHYHGFFIYFSICITSCITLSNNIERLIEKSILQNQILIVKITIKRIRTKFEKKKLLLFYCKNSSLKQQFFLSFAPYYFCSSYCHLSSIYIYILVSLTRLDIKKKLILLIFNLFHCLFKIISSACLGVIAELDAKCSMQCWSYVDRLYMLSN
jgi:hypothetical protein